MTTPLSEARMKICNSCEFNVEGDCALCGCDLSVKTLDPNEKCPTVPSRWPAQVENPTGADLINKSICIPCQKNK